MSTGPTRSSKSSSRHKPLKRGKACMNCRFLKIKCDGSKPICGPCMTHPREDECEYADGPGRSRTKVLEDTVQRLEARLQELENPESSSPSVTLHDPYVQYNTQRISRSPPALIVDSPSVYSPLSPFSPTSTTSSLSSGRHWQHFSALAANAESTGSSGSSSKSPLRRTTLPPPVPTEEPSLASIHAALDGFLPHAEQFGFFLHVPTFRNAALLALPSGHPSLPTPGLLNAVQLMAASLSQSESQHQREAELLRQTVGTVMVDLVENHPKNVVHTLQAQVLLVYYFLRNGSLLQAKVYIGTAVALALGSGLHKIRSVNSVAPSTISLIHDQPHPLPPPADTLQEAERINGFWTVYCLHKLFSVALESPATVCAALEAPGMLIDTPWPIDMENLSEASLPADLHGDATIRSFLNSSLPQVPVVPQMPTSTFGLLTKAATLFHRAAHLTGQWSPAMKPRDNLAYDAAARNINELINQLRSSLPPLPPIHGGPVDAPTRTLLLIHALVDAAAIKLHWIFAYAYSTSKQMCLTAARNLITLYGDMNLRDLGHMNPIMGNLWLTAGLVFIDEISRMRQLKNSFPAAVVDEEELMDCYRSTLEIMSQFSQDCLLMRYHLTKVQEAFEAI